MVLWADGHKGISSHVLLVNSVLLSVTFTASIFADPSTKDVAFTWKSTLCFADPFDATLT